MSVPAADSLPLGKPGVITFEERDKGTLSIRKGLAYVGTLYMATGNGPSISLNTHPLGLDSLTLADMKGIMAKLEGFGKWYEYFYGDEREGRE